MAHRSKTSICIILMTAAACQASEISFEVRHRRFGKDHKGVLTAGTAGLAFQSVGKHDKPLRIQWAYADVQQLYVSPSIVRLLTYEDRKWRLGVDREFEFVLPQHVDLRPLLALVGPPLEHRLVQALVSPGGKPIWQAPAKRLGWFAGVQGVLSFLEDRVAFETERSGQSRTWRYSDITEFTLTGPYELSLATFERSKTHYGSQKNFRFRLKRPLGDELYLELWRRLNRNAELKFLTNLKEETVSK